LRLETRDKRFFEKYFERGKRLFASFLFGEYMFDLCHVFSVYNKTNMSQIKGYQSDVPISLNLYSGDCSKALSRRK